MWCLGAGANLPFGVIFNISLNLYIFIWQILYNLSLNIIQTSGELGQIHIFPINVKKGLFKVVITVI